MQNWVAIKNKNKNNLNTDFYLKKFSIFDQNKTSDLAPISAIYKRAGRQAGRNSSAFYSCHLLTYKLHHIVL